MGFHGGTPADPWLDALGGHRISDDLKRVAGTFVDLQQARHEADYDLSHAFGKSECLDLVRSAQAAFSAWERIRGSLEADVFLAALLAAGNART